MKARLSADDRAGAVLNTAFRLFLARFYAAKYVSSAGTQSEHTEGLQVVTKLGKRLGIRDSTLDFVTKIPQRGISECEVNDKFFVRII